MIEWLDSPSPVLRFWGCFNLGNFACKRATTRLCELREKDREICPGWWYVCEEAEDAIERIAGLCPPSREYLSYRTDKAPVLSTLRA